MHNISFNDQTKQHAFFSRGAAWHALGQNVSEAQTWEQAMQLAGLDWEVNKIQLKHPISNELINAWGTFRSDNDCFLGTVGSIYEPIQNKYQFDFVDALLEMESGAHYETAGALGNGERVFCLAKIGDGIDLHGIGDRHEIYLLFTTSHDGRSSAKVLLTSVRVVCMNTLLMALSRDGKKAVTIRHTKNAQEKLDQAKKLIGAEKPTRERLKEKLEILANRQLRRANLEDVLNKIFPKDKDDKNFTAQSQTAIIEILNRFESNDNDAFPEIRGTAYNLLNAFTEYTDHFRPVRETANRKESGMTETEMRAENALFGKGAEFKGSVLDLILENTKFCQTREIHRPLVSVPGAASKTVVELELEPEESEENSLLDDVIKNTKTPGINSALDQILDGLPIAA